MRIVLDSNLWVSALQFRGLPLDAIRTALQCDTIVFCPQIEREVVGILARKFNRVQHVTAALLDDYLADQLWVNPTGTVQGICRDTKDDMILECALLGNADLLVSGDRDLLTLGNFGPTRIVTARDYLNLRQNEAL